ncbi:unnamed protein product [Adineta ricciae]|uniref:Uncharacterized protein n=1 Tax=Adineta ricciae TaxID=249248 RepID=A0A816GHU8_ADIRI|nr:unnamed protein product [Adineta ricciae]
MALNRLEEEFGSNKINNHRLNAIVNTGDLQQQHAQGTDHGLATEPSCDRNRNTHQLHTFSLLVGSMFGLLVARMLDIIPAAVICIFLIALKLVVL